jgi:hypothetical protein
MLAQQQPNRAVNYGWGSALIVAGLLTLGLGARNLNPKRPWGGSRVEPCPKCGQPHLRDKKMSYRTRRPRATYSSNVVLCDEACGFVTLYKPGTQPVLQGMQPA